MQGQLYELSQFQILLRTHHPFHHLNKVRHLAGSIFKKLPIVRSNSKASILQSSENRAVYYSASREPELFIHLMSVMIPSPFVLNMWLV